MNMIASSLARKLSSRQANSKSLVQPENTFSRKGAKLAKKAISCF